MSGEKRDVEPGVLYVVATPLGNLRDITLRALEVLRSVDLIACEDTRTTLKLLRHYGLQGPRLVAYHEHNEKKKAPEIIAALKAGKSVALVSEAGTPGLCDPGAYLVRLAHEAGLAVCPVPGPCALATALSCSGFALDQGFVFLGFLPAKEGPRRRLFSSLASERRPLVFYEAPHRILQTLRDILETLGERRVFLAREMTKRYEEYRLTSISALLEELEEKGPKGEFTLVLEGAPSPPPGEQPSEDALLEEIQRLREQGLSTKEASRLLAQKYRISSKAVYRLAIEREG